MERDKYFSSLLYSIHKGLNCSFSSETQKKMYPMVRKQLPLLSLLKNGHLQMTLELKPRMGKFCLLYANIASKWNTIIACGEDYALKSICFFFVFFSRKCYIHSLKYICLSCRPAIC